MSRGRSDGSQKKRLVASICVVATFLGFLYVYGGSIFGSQNSGSSTLEYGRSLKRLGSSYLGAEDDTDGKQDESSSSFRQGDGEDNIVPKSFPVCCFVSLDIRHVHYFFMVSCNILLIAIIFNISFLLLLFGLISCINNNELSYMLFDLNTGCQTLMFKYISLVNNTHYI